MKKLSLVCITVGLVAVWGCKGGDSSYKVEKDDPTSVENASKVEPIPMRSDGTPLSEVNGQPEPPKKN